MLSSLSESLSRLPVESTLFSLFVDESLLLQRSSRGSDLTSLLYLCVPIGDCDLDLVWNGKEYKICHPRNTIWIIIIKSKKNLHSLWRMMMINQPEHPVRVLSIYLDNFLDRLNFHLFPDYYEPLVDFRPILFFLVASFSNHPIFQLIFFCFFLFKQNNRKIYDNYAVVYFRLKY